MDTKPKTLSSPVCFSLEPLRNTLACHPSPCLNPCMPPVVAILKRMLAAVASAAVFQVVSPSIPFAAPPQEVSLVCADTTAKPVQHGLSKLKLAVQPKGVVVKEAALLKQATGKHLVVIGLTSSNRLIQMAHDRGLEFTAGIWDHIYRGGVRGGGVPGADDLQR